MTTERKHANGLPTLADIDAKIRAGMDSPDCVFKAPITRTLFEAHWFASELLSFAGRLARLPDGSADDETKFRILREFDAVMREMPLFEEPAWDEAGYAHNNTSGADSIGALRKFADALESVSVAAPDYADGLLRHARAIREILAKSEIAAQGAVRRAVTKERRWYMLWSAVAIGGLFFLWGRPLSFMVGLGFLLCVSALAEWLKAGRTRTEVARRCAEIGWPLGK
ncbi:hypothetical protein BHS06_01935 [Myxococcus xanthus]|uniref:hypothetical protein n=1 Tax=Myxococcus xanthus TaxID=34 RepID=UPI0011274328|nr:hypothetical protein [Myxococcus xanthus]QDE87800.1 hypothetical protein BHS06_01935 [Myxococcus xanthus]